MIALALVLLALGLAVLAPRLMARQPGFRASPRAALVAWQAVTLSAILAALAAAPALAPLVLFDGQAVSDHLMLLALALAVSGLMVGRLLVAGHSIGRRMRRLRRRHRELVDIVSVHPEGERRLRVLEHPAPTAYCLPGRESRVVVSKGVIDALTPREFEAVLTHEGAHLRGRHDLLVEFFSVIHETVPEPVRCQAAMGEVRLLVEALADRAAVRRVGKVATMKALIELEGSRAPEAAMAAGASTTATRLGLIREARPRPALTAVTYAYAVGLLALPIALFAAAWV